ncbi:MAG: DUF3857 domain-containing protein [Planctomycetota bacterium]|jgi:tetratricopeptide (TPR) repeat protein|nr:DUF3857 domain-containing protein [Planctomycetota bacterium]
MRASPFTTRLALLGLLLSGAFSAPAAEPGGPVAAAVWRDLAGWREEIEAEDLELRDELVAAQLSYLLALDKAAAEALGMEGGDPRFAAAWARVEYLMEAAFRLLAQTSEYDAFLESTLPLAPERGEAIPTVPFVEAEGGGDVNGGPVFADGAGPALEPGGADGGGALRYAATGEAPAADDARPRSAVQSIRARAAWLRALAFQRTGRVRSAGEEAAGLGVIRDWLLLGPLDGDLAMGAGGLDEGMREASEALRADVPFAGKNGPVSWRAFASAESLGRLLPEAAFGVDGVSMAYALALVRSPVNGPAAVRFGSDGPATVWVNHAQIRESLPEGPASPDQDVFDVWLREGWNAILVKTMSGPDGWRMILRLTGPGGEPLPCEVAAAERERVPDILAAARRVAGRSAPDRHYRPGRPADQGGMSLLAGRLLDNPDDARAYFYLGSLLTAKRLMEGVGRFDRETIFRRAVELAAGDPFFLLMAARSAEMGVEGPDREENLRLALLRLAAEKGSAAALVDMGRLYLDVMRQPRRAGDYAAAAREANPVSQRAGVLEYDVAAARGWKPLAREILDRLRARHPDSPAVRLRAARAAMERGRYRQALTEFHAILGVDAENGEALFGAVTALGRLGQTSAAVDLLDRQVRRFPYDSASRMRLAQLYRGAGRLDEALAAVNDELRIRPDNPGALAIRREILRESMAADPAESVPGATGIDAPLDRWPPLPEPPSEGWEYLYFQLEDRLRKNGSLDRCISFAARVYTPAAAVAVRHLGFVLDGDFETGSIAGVTLVHPDGIREPLSSPGAASGADAVKLSLPPLTPGTVVEGEIRIHRRRVPFLGDYFGQAAALSQPAPVRFYRYMFTHPAERRFAFQSANGAPEALVLPDGAADGVTRVWELEDVPGFVREPDAPAQEEAAPTVRISSFADWDEFARWYWRLIGAQYHTPPELRLLAARAGGVEPFPMSRLDRASEWIADNLGVRDWEFGLYAFRPIGARAILSRRSADAKDRTLLLCLLADAYGLRAWPVLARSVDPESGRTGVDRLDLPLLDHFSHSLAAVETEAGGDVLLDASSPYRPPGVAPAALFGTNAVKVTPSGGELVIIPDSGILGCEWSEESEATVDEDGGVLWEQKVRGAGTAAEALRARFRDEATREGAWAGFLDGLGALSSASACDFADGDPSPAHALFSGRARIRRLSRSAGMRLTMNLPPPPGRIPADGGQYEYPLSLGKYARLGEREQPLLLPSVFSLARRIGVSYPPEWRLENPPGSMEAEFPFGKIALSVSMSPGRLQCDLSVVLTEKVVSPGDYASFRRVAAFVERWRRPFLSWEKP